MAYTRAACLVAMNRVDEASTLLEGVNAENVAALAGDPYWGANLELAKAQIGYIRHDFAAARTHLEAAKPGFSIPKAESYQVRAVSLLDSSLLARESR